jgi:hypothetical protein
MRDLDVLGLRPLLAGWTSGNRVVSRAFARWCSDLPRGPALAWPAGYRHNPSNWLPGDARVVRRVLWISVPEVILHGAQIGAPVGQVVAAAVPQHVRPDPAKPRGLAGHPDDVVHGLGVSCACRSEMN